MPLQRLDANAPVEATEPYALTEDDIIVDRATGLPLANWSKLATVVNKVDIKYDFNVDGLVAYNFGREEIFTASTSVDRYSAQQAVALECRGIRTSLADSDLMRARLALLFEQYWGFPPPVLLCSVTWRRHMFSLLDRIRVTHSKIPSFDGGQMGLDGELFMVLTASPQFFDAQGTPAGRMDLALLQVGAIETSAVPLTSGALLLALSAAESTVKDETDQEIGLASSVTVTTEANCVRFRLGLKAWNYRQWRCEWGVYNEVPHKGGPSTCAFSGSAFDKANYGSQITYHVDYKTSGAPDAPGSGGDPTTGWVELIPSSTRGTVSRLNYAACGANISDPGYDPWTYFKSDPGGSPATYNVKVFYDSVAKQGDPCGIDGHTNCSLGACSDTLSGAGVILADQQILAVDFIESVVSA